MTFSRNDCPKTEAVEQDLRSCITHENEALLPNLATSQVFSSLDKIKDYATQIKNNYHTNKINNRPYPEDTDYFYDDYVDYPYNETLIEGIKNEMGLTPNQVQDNIEGIPVIYAGMKNTTNTKVPASISKPGSSFTFFGMPIPPIDVGKLLNTGRKIDWPVNKKTDGGSSNGNKVYERTEPPKFETGGFSPMMPTTSGGFMPIPDPTLTVTQATIQTEAEIKYSRKGSTEQSIIEVVTKTPIHKVESNSTHKKIKSEIHELQAFLNDDNSTHVAYNRTKNVEEQKTDPNNMSKYNLMESNMTITHVTEKEGLLITTDTTNDISMQTWMESSTMSYSSSTAVTVKPSVKKLIESQPTALSAILIPNNPEIGPHNFSKRPATVTKVIMPPFEHHVPRDTFPPVSNREAKTRFSDSMSLGSTRTREIDDKDWYYKNYNNSNLEPYVDPVVHTSSSSNINNNDYYFFVSMLLLICFTNYVGSKLVPMSI